MEIGLFFDMKLCAIIHHKMQKIENRYFVRKAHLI